MGGFDHQPSSSGEERSVEVQAQHARLGLRLFAIYFVLYACFMGLVAFGLPVLSKSVAGGLNLALVYGLGLIAAALLLAFIYGWKCRTRSGPDGSEAHR